MRETAGVRPVACAVLKRRGMLRSIIAIWGLAIGLVIVAATVGCMGGCLNGDDCGSFGTPSVNDMAHPVAPQCASSCRGCASDQICFQAPLAAQLPAFCAKQCASDNDCGINQICATLFASLQPPVCINAGWPKGCGGATANWHCDLAPASCKDASTLSQPFSHADDQVCGWELVHCANGCDTDHCK
jgi:hypothetical protein